MDDTAVATVVVAVVTAVVAPLVLQRYQAAREDRRTRHTAQVEDRVGERTLLQTQLETLLREQTALRESLRGEIRERDAEISKRDERIERLETRVGVVEQTLLDYQSGRVAPPGYVLVPVAYVIAWRRGEQLPWPVEPFVGELPDRRDRHA